MSEETPLAAIGRYLKKQHVLSVCGGEPVWCASCFYIYDPQRVAFWLMTEMTTRHGAQMREHPDVAGTVSGQPKSVMLIKGVQYAGTISLLEGEAAQSARMAYVRRFPVAVKATAPLWEIRISELKMTNNALGFGHKLHWARDESRKKPGEPG